VLLAVDCRKDNYIDIEMLGRCLAAKALKDQTTVEGYEGWKLSLPSIGLPLGRSSSPVVLRLYKHTEPLRSFQSFCRTPFLRNITESKNGLHVSADLRRIPETAPSNPRVGSNPV